MVDASSRKTRLAVEDREEEALQRLKAVVGSEREVGVKEVEGAWGGSGKDTASWG